MKNLIYSFLLVIIVVGLGGCSENLLNENPPHIIGPDALYTDLEGFQAGINGLYSLVVEERTGINRNDINNEIMMNGTDIMYGNQRASVGQVLNQWQERNNSQYFMYERLWEWLYGIVNSANTIVNRAQNPDIDWTEEEKNGIVTEARTIRAWAYRHLTYLWGDVPLTLNESTGQNIQFDWTRTPIDSVRQAMEADWLFAKQHLPETPPQPGKLTKGVAQHYLAELYLAMGENEKARDEALELIDSGPFSLITQRYGVESDEPGTPFTDMFIDGNSNYDEGNSEVLWTFQAEYLVPGGDSQNIMRRWHVNRYYNFMAVTVERGGRGIGRIGPTNYVIQLYEDGDDRGSKHAWRYFYIYDAEVDDIPEGFSDGDTVFVYEDRDEQIRDTYWPSTQKWDSAPEQDVTEAQQYNDQIYLRLGETYLLLAEAQLKLGNTGTAKPGAAWAINQLRERANATLITPGEVDLNFILDERARELYSEEQRRYTLLRTNTWLERTRIGNTIAGPEITERDKLYPIPQDVIDANTQGVLRQNPGY